MACPVMALACSEQRNSAARAISSAVCPRPCRSVLRNPSNCSLGLTPSFLASTAPSSFDIVVSVTGPGQSAFTRTPFRPASAAVTRVSPSIPAFAAAYAEPHANADFADKLEIFRITPEPRAYISGSTSLLSKNAAHSPLPWSGPPPQSPHPQSCRSPPQPKPTPSPTAHTKTPPPPLQQSDAQWHARSPFPNQ